MASSLPVVIDESLLVCKLCYQSASKPKLLPCLHLFCTACLDSYISKQVTDYKAEQANAAPAETSSQTCRPSRTGVGLKVEDADGKDRIQDGVKDPSKEEQLDEEYEIPWRTTDDDGYQIANDLGRSVYTNQDANYYNSQGDLSPEYLDMKSVKTGSRSLNNLDQTNKQKANKTKVRAAVPDLKSSKVPVEERQDAWTGDLYELAGEGVYDNMEDEHEQSKVQSSVCDRDKSGTSSKRRSSSNLKRRVEPPKLVRRPKGSGRRSQPSQQDSQEKSEISHEGTDSSVQQVQDNIFKSIDRRGKHAPVAGDRGAKSPEGSCYGMERPVSEYEHKSSEFRSISNSTYSFEKRKSGLVHIDEFSNLKFPCPACEEISTSTVQEGANRFSDCSFISALQEMVVLQKEASEFCRNCETKPAEHRCFDCQTELCEDCRVVHGWLQITKRHRVVKLEDLRHGRYQKEIQAMLAPPCGEECENEATDYCVFCKQFACRKCSDANHDEHSVASPEVVASRERDYIRSLEDDARGKLERVREDRAKLDAYCSGKLEECDSAVRSILKQKETLLRMVEEHTKMLLKKVAEQRELENATVNKMLVNFDNSINRIQHSLRFSDELLNHGRHSDVVTLADQVKTNLSAIEHLSFPVKPDSTLSIDFRPTDIEKDDIKHIFGYIYIEHKQECERQQTRDHLETKEASLVRKPLILSTFQSRVPSDQKGCKPTAVAVTPEDRLVLVDDINKKLKVFNKNGTLEREICPEGEHRLVDPWDVAVIPACGYFAVTDRGSRDVKIFTENGEFVSSFGPHLTSPWGIATNSIGQILVTDTSHGRVFVHDGNGNLLFPVPSELPADHVSSSSDDRRLLHCPEYVCANVNNDVIVSDFERHTVTIFDRYGRFMSRYGDKRSMDASRKLKVPCGIAVDKEGDIYVADYNNRRIVRMTRNGRFVCSYVTNDSNLVMPQALCFNSDGHLAVVDRTSVNLFALSADDVKEAAAAPNEAILAAGTITQEGAILAEGDIPSTKGVASPQPKPRKKDSTKSRTSKTSSEKVYLSSATSSPLPVKHSKSAPEVGDTEKPDVVARETDNEEKSKTKSYMETEVW